MLQIILVQGFRLLKIKITQFPGGFRLLLPWVPETFLARFPVSVKYL